MCCRLSITDGDRRYCVQLAAGPACGMGVLECEKLLCTVKTWICWYEGLRVGGLHA